MSRSDPQFNLRLPVELKERLSEAATSNKRSITGEIIARLEDSFEAEARKFIEETNLTEGNPPQKVFTVEEARKRFMEAFDEIAKSIDPKGGNK
jgi:predicted HicB family RNase H-like nuclease